MRGALAAVATSLLVLLLAPAAGASHDPSGAPFGEDFLTGTSVSEAGTFRTILVFDAHSGPSGESPTGTVRVDIESPEFPTATIDTAPVSCLNVAGNRATVGFRLPILGISGLFFAEDNDGAAEDRSSGGVPVPTPTPSICPTTPSALPPHSGGDLIVHDAPALPTSKEQCKNGGWRNFGTAFKSQGQCVAFVERHPQP
jgi:hypothetical protein